MLNRLGISSSANSTRRHITKLSSAALAQARDLMDDASRVKVLLYDNVDIYLSVGAQRLTASAQLLNLTTRTLLRLPASFSSTSISMPALSALDRPRKLDAKEVLGDGKFLRRAGMIHIMEAIQKICQHDLKEARAHQNTFRYIQEAIGKLKAEHALDEIAAEKWDVAPLSLLEENEGSIDGTIAVLAASALTLGILEDGPAIETQSSDSMSTGSDGDNYVQTSVLGAGGILLVVGDLKTHRNVEAAQHARQHHDRSHERLDFVRSSPAPWHLLLNWIWAIFRTHFSHSKVGYAACLERQRDALRRGRTALREEEPSFNEAWALIRHVFQGWIKAGTISELKSRRKDLSTWAPTSSESVCTLVEDVWVSMMSETATHAALKAKDEIGANARLFLRDAALALEWADACRVGDLGRMFETEKFMAVGFAGAGKHQYAEACLDDIWARKVLQADAFRTLMAARLINRTGRREGFIGADLYQEHLNKEIQRVDTSHGAECAIARLKDTYSATAEISRSFRSAHAQMFDRPRANRDRSAAFAKDVNRIAALAQEDGLFVLKPNRTVGRSGPSIPEDEVQGPTIPTALTLLDEAVDMGRAEDLLEVGWIRMRDSRLQMWSKHRGGMDRYEAYIREQLKTSDQHILDEAGHLSGTYSQGVATQDEDELGPLDDIEAETQHIDTHVEDEEMEAGDVGWLEDGERVLREREWNRRQEEVNAACAEEEAA
ncbi:hypothetical protein A4X13_0g3416 [Tilletia indica]|uniref:DUF6589 domain-containing protein n=1 Tax=Tilletia indica TaxID=43049 RepID=A0A8T8T217_9BASI|nr:hypothetical protein A4X13_0g3416 [Tilletia indica]